MKIGIYLNGLGQSVAHENALSYATRLTNELNKDDEVHEYKVKLEKIEYVNGQKCNVISVLKTEIKKEKQSTAYKFYEFEYGRTMTQNFVKSNLIYKNYLLLSVVVTKFPIMVWRMLKPSKQYHAASQTVYVFLLFLLLALAILMMVPTTLSLFMTDDLVNAVKKISLIYEPIHWLGVSRASIVYISEKFVSLIALLLLIMPQANLVVTGLATEFVSAHLYLQYGEQKSDVLGNLDLLYEYIVSNEKDSEIHIHAYSFGTLIALDYLYPYKNKLFGNTLNHTKGLITIAAPFDFINSYYPHYYNDRDGAIESKDFEWINVYSEEDSLASNFRNHPNPGDSEYGVIPNGKNPINIEYEVISCKNYGFFNYIALNNIKVHGMYWSENTNGKSCLGPIYLKMAELNLI